MIAHRIQLIEFNIGVFYNEKTDFTESSKDEYISEHNSPLKKERFIAAR